MSKTKELWKYQDEEKVWVGKYLNSHNISHWHNDFELVFVNNGSLEVMIDGLTYIVNQGQSVLINSKKIHNMHAKIDNTIASIFIFDQGLVQKHLKKYELESPILRKDYNLSSLYNSLFNELTLKPYFYQENTKLLIQSLLVDIYRNEKIIESKENKKLNENLLYLIDKINEEYRYFTFENAVEIMNMNPSYFSRFFSLMTGIGFAKYLNCVRIEKAVELINEYPNKPMTEIADLCGFQTIRNFNRIFKSYTGYSPKHIPKNYIFNGLQFVDNSKINNPTLTNCKLIEYSSPHN